MTEPFDKLQRLWRSQRCEAIVPLKSSEEIIVMARKQKRKAVILKSTNVLIMTFTLIGIASFFTLVAKMQQTVSLLGEAVMLGSLAVRIALEFISIYMSSSINLSDSSVRTNVAFRKYYSFRKKIHGPLTITVLALYTIGFYMLIPEFSLYLPTTIIVMIHVSYVVGAIIVGFSIKNGIRSEMACLNEIQRLQKDLANENFNAQVK